MENKKTVKKLKEAGEDILAEIDSIKAQLTECRLNFELATDENLIDCYIYQLHALNKKYQYFLKLAKENNLAGFDNVILRRA